MSTIDKLKKHLVPGHTYRREDLALLSSNVDRHIAQLVSEGLLKKLETGIYLAPKKTAFGEALPDEMSLLKTFLKDDRFVVYSPSQFNTLGLGLTQLYNTRVVFNRKRSGRIKIGARTYTFQKWREAPKELSIEFLFVEMLNRLNKLAEDPEAVLEMAKNKVHEMNRLKLGRAAERFGTVSTKKRLKQLWNAQGSY